MKDYHFAWLSVHPERTATWLECALADGFDVHHLDGNHENNDPANLVLIDCGDHFMLHGTNRRISRMSIAKPGGVSADVYDSGKQAYEMYLDDQNWGAVAERMALDYYSDATKVRTWAQKYAKASDRKWPIGHQGKGRKCRPKVFAPLPA
jgi:hypothetical protein